MLINENKPGERIYVLFKIQFNYYDFVILFYSKSLD